MSDLFTVPPGHNQATPPSNVPIQSVSDVAQGVKRTVEAAFGRIRIRGEISRPNYHRSGHLYLTLKDDRAVIDAVSWKGQVSKLGFRVEEGMEVIATGKLTTFPGGSKYQIVVESMEIAGEGALLKMLEDRRKKLAAEGLFEDSRKRPLPLLPTTIGVVTSPTGAVIRDILHRLRDRFPRHVLLWPVSVQGDAAAGQIARAISGFNALVPNGNGPPRPDVLIVGRGGGSLEDLWCFNEEIVVRAVAESAIPVISAVGHETDTTLIDYAADRRAPTPTGAAEMAVPVRADEMVKLGDLGQRLSVALRRRIVASQTEVEGLGRGLASPERLVQDRIQTIDLGGLALDRALQSRISQWQKQFESLANRLPHPKERVRGMTQALQAQGERLDALSSRLIPTYSQPLKALEALPRMQSAFSKRLQTSAQQLDGLARVLQSVQSARQRLLDQGYIYATTDDGTVISSMAQVSPNLPIRLHMGDGVANAVLEPDDTQVASTPSQTPKAKTKSKAKVKAKVKAKNKPNPPSPSGVQGTLL